MMKKMSDIWMTETKVREMLGFRNVHSFRCAQRGLGLAPKFRSGSRDYYARADVERVLKDCAGSAA